MLKLAAYPAQGFLANAEVRGNAAQGNPFQNVWGLLKKIFVSFPGSFKLGIHKSFFQAEIIFFVDNSYQSFNLMMLVKQFFQLFLGNGP